MNSLNSLRLDGRRHFDNLLESRKAILMNVGMLVLEEDLKERYPLFESECCSNIGVLSFKNILKSNWLGTLSGRFGTRKHLKTAFESLPDRIKSADILFISNTEGYIANNIVSWLRKNNPDMIIISLQHGMFLFHEMKLKTLIAKCISNWMHYLIGFSLIGTGFFNANVDGYVVYNKNYKKMLLDVGANPHGVFMGASLLKGINYKGALGKERVHDADSSAVFLLQPLSALGMLSERDERSIINTTIKWMSTQYKKVYIKQHPYCKITIDWNESVTEVNIGNISEIYKIAGTAVSFFSEALNDCRAQGMKSIAIYDSEINVDSRVYDFFPSVIKFVNDNVVSIETKYSNNEYYEDDVQNIKELKRRIVDNLKPISA